MELVGGDWNHGMDYDFPETVGNGIIIPTDELILFRGIETTNQIPSSKLTVRPCHESGLED